MTLKYNLSPWTSVSTARQNASPRRDIDLAQYAFVQIGHLTNLPLQAPRKTFGENSTRQPDRSVDFLIIQTSSKVFESS